MLPTNLPDSKISALPAALDPHRAQAELKEAIPHLRRVHTVTLLRHKPGRRALIAYQLETTTGDCTVLGKIRSKGTDWRTYRLQQALWSRGFAADSADGFSVPEPMGVVPAWQMWLQRQVPGISATELLPTDRGAALAGRIAQLAHKLHQANPPTDKTHTLADELNILQQRLPLVSQERPQWQARIERVLAACREWVTATPVAALPACGVHRDFYGDQVLVERAGSGGGCDRIWLVDLDLYCQGHPALDIGNFIAHITEQSLRQLGDAAALKDREEALQEKFIAVAGAQNLRDEVSKAPLRQAISLYTTLTLVRHIYISHRIPSRRALTESILALCEQRLRA